MCATLNTTNTNRNTSRKATANENESASDDDHDARNTTAEPERVGLASNGTVAEREGVVTVTLPPVSWTVLTLG